jgi:hypothetical protein
MIKLTVALSNFANTHKKTVHEEEMFILVEIICTKHLNI